MRKYFVTKNVRIGKILVEVKIQVVCPFWASVGEIDLQGESVRCQVPHFQPTKTHTYDDYMKVITHQSKQHFILDVSQRLDAINLLNWTLKQIDTLFKRQTGDNVQIQVNLIYFSPRQSALGAHWGLVGGATGGGKQRTARRAFTHERQTAAAAAAIWLRQRHFCWLACLFTAG